MLDELRGKKIAILGLGKNNKYLSEFLAKEGIAFEVISDWKSADELVGQLDNYEIVFRSPGLPYYSKAIQQAKSKGVEISSQTKLFFKLCKNPIIGVTGTKGKGTASSLITKILQSAGKKVWLGGNIGTDPFEFISQISPDDLVVLELSSFQLQDLEQSPHIAIVLSITPDHLNHHKDFEEYVAAKLNIISHQVESDFAVLHPALPEDFKSFGKGKKILFDPKNVGGFKTKLLGQHNLDNIAAAVEVAKIIGIDESTIKKAVAEFEPLPHRLKFVKEVDGVKYIDDGFSTNVDPTIAAINAVRSSLVLIVGGHDKGLDFTTVGQAIKKSNSIKGLVVVGQMTKKILKAVDGFEGKILTGAKNMEEILSQANSLTQKGDTVLFSPGTSSFDMFKNETDRAEQFVNQVEKL